MIDRAIRDVFQNFTDGVNFPNPQWDAQRLETTLRAELEGSKAVYSVDCDSRVGILALEDAGEALYVVDAPLTVSRELLNLDGATVREKLDLLSDDGAQLSVELQDGRVLNIGGLRAFNREQQAAIRAELERRARRLAR